MGVGARARQPEPRARSDDRVRLDGHGRGAAASSTACSPQNPDLAYSRLLCPRSWSQHGVPRVPRADVRDGRLAGLGLDPSNRTDATLSRGRRPAAPEPERAFRTTTAGTSAPAASATSSIWFGCCKPQPVDPRVGRATWTCSIRARTFRASSSRDARRHPEARRRAAGAGRTLLAGRLAGVPRSTRTGRTPLSASASAGDLARSSILPTTTRQPARGCARRSPIRTIRRGDPDPLITPPLYGRWHALTERLLTRPRGTSRAEQRNWVHELNLDPRFRVPAGFGTRVVQDQQEELHERRVGAGRRRARGEPADPAGATRQRGVVASGTTRASRAALRASARSRLLRLTAPVQQAGPRPGGVTVTPSAARAGASRR